MENREIKTKIKIDSTDIDDTLEKVERLAELLEKVQQIVNSLFGN